MHFIEHLPNRILSPYISSYWEIEYSIPNDTVISVTFGCTGNILLIFSIKGSYNNCKKEQGEAITRTESALVGQVIQPYTQCFSGQTLGIVVAFTPSGLSSLCKFPVNQFTDQSFHLPDVLPEFHSLTDQLFEATTAQRFAILDAHFLKKVTYATTVDRRIDAAAEILRNRPGKYNIRQLAHHVNCSERTLNRRFTEKVGLSPKKYAQVHRFLHVKRWLVKNPHPNWQELLSTMGYFDQSHLINEFRHFTGKSPLIYMPTFSSNYDLVW